jgi:hypothetical protein
MTLWTALPGKGGTLLMSPKQEPKVWVHSDPRFARALCHVLNSTPTEKLMRTDEEMDLRGVPRV